MTTQGKILALVFQLAAAMPMMGSADENAEVCFVARGDKLPNGRVQSNGDLARIKPMLSTLPEGHRIRVEFATVHKSITGYKEDVRYARLMVSVDVDDKPDGQEIEFSDWYRRPSRTAEYRHGVRQGVERLYDTESGCVLSETPWENGRIQGVKRTFHLNGKLSNETTYEKGVSVGQSRAYNPDGGLIRVVNYTDGKRDGDSIDYWPDKPSAVQRIVPYKKNLVDGVARGYYLNGKIKWERPFTNNQQHGVEKQYSADGLVEKVFYWVKGCQVSAEEYRAKTGE